MSARNPCSIMVAGENKSFALSSLRGKSGTFMIPAYSTGGVPPGFGVKAEAAMRRGFEAYSARNGSASCQLSPLSETGIKSTTRTPASGGFGTSRSDPLQATHRATPTVITLARIAHAPPGFAAARGSRQDNGSLVAGAVMRARNTIAVRTLQLEAQTRD